MADETLAAAVAGLTAEVAGLHSDRARRKLLDLATGVLVDQLGVTPAVAADHLLDLAVSTGLGAADLAADIVNAAAGELIAEPPAEARRILRRTAEVLSADSAGEAAETLLAGGMRRIGVQALYLWRRTDTDCLELAGTAGAGAQEKVHWQWVPPDTTLHRVLWDGQPWWGVDDWLPGGPGGPGSLRAVLPLRRHGGVVGVALAVWAAGTVPDYRTRWTAQLLCEPCGVLLENPDPRAGVRAPVPESALLDLFDRPAALVEADGVVSFLNGPARTALGAVHAPAGRTAAEVFPYAWPWLEAAAERKGAQYLGRLEDMDDVRVLPLGRGSGRAAVLWSTEAHGEDALARVLGRLDRVAHFREDLVSGATRWSAEAYRLFGVDPDRPAIPLARLGPRLDPEDLDRLQELVFRLVERHEGGRAVVRTVRTDDGVRYVRIAAEPLLTGSALTGLTGIYQDVSALHRSEVALSAAQQDAFQRTRFVRQLQEVIVPAVTVLAEAPGLEIAARYRPAAHDYRVGGDWYDVIALRDGRALLAVGDIAGHGLDAATSMVALRNALRGLAVTGAGPGRLMAWLNEVTLQARGRPTATAVCALFDPAEGSLRWATAGHLPLLLLREGRARFLQAPHNILLGALPGAEYVESATRLAAGDVLLLYTDGLVERRHVGMDESLAALRGTAEGLTGGSAESRADALLGAVTGDTDDDTSLVVVRVSPA
ncbi:SpoIIE family protein phosphatase [Streptomyces sp. NPDC051211]|uniref:SpoIIE family protein phosphatase n=1 Tax=Streptomyces sp. NPDC051211 TaxID=3154643 RepID=UPI00344D6C74